MSDSKTVTVLFTDVVGSSELRTSRGDAPAHQMLEAHDAVVRREIEQHGGREIKTIGDSFMVAFSSAHKAVDCAVSIQRALSEYNQNNPEQQVHIRVGMNTGEVIEKGGDLFGATVDAAARVMSKAAGGQILIPENTRNALGDGEGIPMLDRGPFWLKGFPERWRLHEVLWHEEGISTAAAAPHIGHRTPFVGREKERADLRRYMESARGGHGLLVMIGGEPGVGKTRITEELVAEARRHGFLTLTGHCHEMEGSPPYIPFVEIIETAVHIAEPEALLDTLGDSAPEVAKLMPELRLKFPDISTPLQLPPEQERRRMFNGVLDFISRAARIQALLLIIEDLHWADESTMLLLQHIVQRLGEIPVLVVGTYRDTELDVARSLARALEELLRRRLAHDLVLRRLPATDVAEMLQKHDKQNPPRRLVELVYRETEGNPFFVEEVYNHLAEEGKLFDTEGRWRSDVRIGETEVPRGVRLVIGRRLERVSEECRSMLTAAAIIGRGFDFDLLERLEIVSEEALFDAIDEAERAQLITSKSEHGKPWFIFSHELIRQTLVAGLSLPRRQRYHLRVAETLERLHTDSKEKHAADFAHHFYLAGGDPEKVINYSVMAAERATAQTAYEEAVNQYERALQTLEEQKIVDEFQRCKLLLKLGKALGNSGDSDQAQKSFLQVTEIARKLPAPDQFAEAVLALFQFKRFVGFADGEYLNLLQEGLSLLGDADSIPKAGLMGLMSVLLEYLNDERRFSMSEEAVAMARRIGDRKTLHYVLWNRSFIWDRPLEEKLADAIESAGLDQEVEAFGGVNYGLVYICHYHWEQGNIGAALADLNMMRKLAEDFSFSDMMSKVKFVQSTYAQMTGNFDEAEGLALEGLMLGQTVNRAVAAQQYTALILIIRHLQGRLDEIDEAIQLARSNSHPVFRAVGANMHLMLGREEQARKELENLVAHDFKNVPRDHALFHVLAALSDVAIGLHDIPRAALIYDIWSPYADHLCMIGIGNGCCGATTHYLGMLAGTMKRWNDAVAHFENAIETNTRIGARPFLARSQHEYARMLVERDSPGEKERIRTLLTEATATYRELGMPTFLENAEELLAKL